MRETIVMAANGAIFALEIFEVVFFHTVAVLGLYYIIRIVLCIIIRIIHHTQLPPRVLCNPASLFRSRSRLPLPFPLHFPPPPHRIAFILACASSSSSSRPPLLLLASDRALFSRDANERAAERGRGREGTEGEEKGQFRVSHWTNPGNRRKNHGTRHHTRRAHP